MSTLIGPRIVTEYLRAEPKNAYVLDSSETFEPGTEIYVSHLLKDGKRAQFVGPDPGRGSVPSVDELGGGKANYVASVEDLTAKTKPKH